MRAALFAEFSGADLCKPRMDAHKIYWYNIINGKYTEKRVIPMATKAEKERTARYLAKFDAIRARVPKGDLQKYKDFAAANGYSLNALVVGLLNAALDGSVPLPPKK